MLRNPENSKLKITEKKGEVMGVCATLNSKYICCNVHVVHSVSNCPFSCSYCFLQNYLNESSISVIGDHEAMLKEVKEKINREPRRFFRIGTWELGDSLALESRVPSALPFIESFAKLPNAILELKTKSNNVDGILHASHQGKTVVSWSMNPQTVIDQEEHGTASLEQRISAMEKVVAAGYLVGIHFDPMILYEGWESGYEDLVKQIFDRIPAPAMAWISIGSLRFNPEMKKKIEINYPGNRLTSAEMILGDDNKVRYVKPLRVKMYRRLYQAIMEYGGRNVLLYLCMERDHVWKKVLGYSPDSIEHLDYIFAESLHRRFPGLVQTRPERSWYEKAI